MNNNEVRELLLKLEQNRTLENQSGAGCCDERTVGGQIYYGDIKNKEKTFDDINYKRLDGLLGSNRSLEKPPKKRGGRVQGDFLNGGAAGGAKLGKEYALELQKHLHGGESFWDGFKRGFNSVIKPVTKVVKAVAPALPYGNVVKSGLEAVGYGKAKKKKRQPSAKQKARGELIKKLMREHGLSFGEASRYIKQNNLI
jgi:hypothetical protein